MAVNEPSAGHADHDELWLVAYAAGDLPEPERVAAEELVRSCPDCARLVEELRLIRAATASLPAPRRRRDFRLTADDAARLRPRGWRRLLVPLAGPRFAFTQPLAAGLVTIGIAVLLLATVPGSLSGSASAPGPMAGGAPTESAADKVAPLAGVEAAPSEGAGVPSEGAGVPSEGPPAVAPLGPAGALGTAPTAEPAPAGSEPAPSAAVAAPVAPAPAPSEGARRLTAQPSAQEAAGRAAEAAGAPPLPLIATLLLVAGIGLFLLRWGARRLART